MAKKVEKLVKLQIPAGKATPAPPVGPALGQAGINIMGFTKEFNARTADQAGMIIPVVITVYEDKSFDFVTKTSGSFFCICFKFFSASFHSSGCTVYSLSPERSKLQKISQQNVILVKMM